MSHFDLAIPEATEVPGVDPWQHEDQLALERGGQAVVADKDLRDLVHSCSV